MLAVLGDWDLHIRCLSVVKVPSSGLAHTDRLSLVYTCSVVFSFHRHLDFTFNVGKACCQSSG